MKRSVIIWILVFALVLGGCAVPTNPTDIVADNGTEQQTQQGASSQEGAGVPVSCMSFNILAYNTGAQTFPSADQRVKWVVPFIMEKDADIVGIQEAATQGDFNWADAIVEQTKGTYTARRVDEEIEFGAAKMHIGSGLIILYRTDRFELLDSGCSYYFEDSNRYWQWVQLKDKKSGRELYVTNTHFSIDPWIDGKFVPEEGEQLRTWEAEELLAFWEEKVGDSALFATGDYNAAVDSTPHITLQSGIYNHSLEAAIESDGQSTVDFCYINTKCMEVDKYEFLDARYTDQNGESHDMSDHNPIMTYAIYK